MADRYNDPPQKNRIKIEKIKSKRRFKASFNLRQKIPGK